MSYIIDTYAWMEYLTGSKLGQEAKPIIEQGNNYTPTIVLAELKKRFVELSRTDFEQVLTFIHQHSDVLPLDETSAILAGEIRATIGIKGMGLVDCILLALARVYNCKVLTGDEHFKKLPEAEFLAE